MVGARPAIGQRTLQSEPNVQRLGQGLVEAEVRLSACRRALHERIDACTAQPVDHYQRDPAQITR